MDSDEDDQQFAGGRGGEALDLEDDFDSEGEGEDDEEEEEEEVPQPPVKKPQQNNLQPMTAQQKKSSPGKQGDIKGQHVENQPYDIAVEVNDSEEIDSDEEADEVRMSDSKPKQ